MSNNDWGFERMAQPSRPQEDVRNMPYTTPSTPQPTKVLRDERLERIATAALQGLITGVVSVPELAAAHSAGAKQKGFTFEQYMAIDAMALAKALIAELDKQA